MRRRDFLAAIAVASANTGVFAQTGTVSRLAIVNLSVSRAGMQEHISRYNAVLMGELRRLGHVEGKNLVIDRYSAERRAEGVETIIASLFWLVGRSARSVDRARIV